MTTFNDLGLAAPLLKALESEGYTTPTPIQAQAIPSLMTGRDLLGIAQTGTGKTAAFALPILHRLQADPKPAPRRGARVLVLSPTRELASQIAESFETYGRHLRLRVAVIFGGVGYRPQIDALNRGLDVLVATPGRLLDHIGERNCDLRNTEVLVLDEADQMLDLGFIKPIRQIVADMPSTRQNLLFSATMPREIASLADQLLTNPVKVAVTPVATTVDRVAQRVIHVDASRKRALLAELLSDAALTRALVFTRTKRGADRVAQHLESCGIKVASIHGNKSQRQREIALDDFKDGKIRVLVATDIAARGIDVDQVSHVVNFELPDVPEAYVHRIGRTARAGATGIAISLCAPDERDQLRQIERTTRQTIPSEDRRNDQALEADAHVPRERNDRRPKNGGRPERDTSRAGGRGPHRGGDRGGQRGDQPRRPDERREARGPADASRRDGARPARAAGDGARRDDRRDSRPTDGAGRRDDRRPRAAGEGETTGANLGHMRFMSGGSSQRGDAPRGGGRDRGDARPARNAASNGGGGGGGPRKRHRKGQRPPGAQSNTAPVTN